MAKAKYPALPLMNLSHEDNKMTLKITGKIWEIQAIQYKRNELIFVGDVLLLFEITLKREITSSFKYKSLNDALL